ncbi:Spy/CpxP family protein refolding chaperone [Chelatococcus sp. SYSU_G07232]|uniref:Spy/CpxP family protein refolding chaperone n=1 Tax=Chelatococcus albus TaxID=3047466 RepID=A0ABT7AGJ5_9HYPH|nr:Spy/CpxP family protein refolding chaperone [Chelatococcus sp. SYSU_G07232]MDJ1158487.1 Spy/CpxP family protein refolding chaperone [Chelatococcus sp. SYSU_G07232]
MKRALATATVAALVAGSAFAITAQAQPSGGPRADGPAQHRMTPEDFSALTDARIAALKAGLKLTTEQEKNWPALEVALRDTAKARAERFAKMREERREAREEPNPIERLRMHAEMMSSGAANMKKIADAAEPLYKSLDDAQKRRFGMLMRNAQGGHPMGMGGRAHRMRHAEAEQ